MRTGVICFDVDGVLADCSGQIIEYLNRDRSGQALYNKGMITEYSISKSLGIPFSVIRSCMSEPGFVRTMQPLPLLAYTQELRCAGHTVLAVTAPFYQSPHWMHERAEWLQEHGFAAKDIIMTSSKHFVDGDVLVDDRPEHIVDWTNSGENKYGVLWAASHNTRFDSLSTVEELSAKLESLGLAPTKQKHTVKIHNRSAARP